MKITSLFIGLLCAHVVLGQDVPQVFQQGLELKEKRDHEACIVKFTKCVEAEPNNAEYLAQLSQSYSRAGALMAKGDKQSSYYKKAKELAQKAKKINQSAGEARLAFAIALARENEHASTKTKISNAKMIKAECDAVFKARPDDPTACHIMGRWHRTFASLNGFERAMINTLYGGTPEGGTFADALEMFRKAIKQEPELSMHVYELAETYYEMREKEYARKFAQKVLDYPLSNKDAEVTRAKAEALLKKL